MMRAKLKCECSECKSPVELTIGRQAGDEFDKFVAEPCSKCLNIARREVRAEDREYFENIAKTDSAISWWAGFFVMAIPFFLAVLVIMKRS